MPPATLEMPPIVKRASTLNQRTPLLVHGEDEFGLPVASADGVPSPAMTTFNLFKGGVFDKARSDLDPPVSTLPTTLDTLPGISDFRAKVSMYARSCVGHGQHG